MVSNEPIGESLKQAREAQGLTIDAVSAELRIGAHCLQALEDERFDELGARVFAKGYLKQYGSRLGLNVDDLGSRFDAAVGGIAAEIAPSKTITLRDERLITVWLAAAISLVVVAAILSVWWWLGSDSFPDAELAAAPQAAAPDVVAPGPEPELTREPEPEVDTEPEPLPVPVQELVAPAVVVPEVVAEVDEAATAVNAVPPVRQLIVRFQQDSWAEISDSANERLFYDLGRAGSTASVPADRVLRFFFGNVRGIELELEGEAVPLPAGSIRGDLGQFTLDFSADSAQ